MQRAQLRSRSTWLKAFLLMAFLVVASTSFFPAEALRVIGDCETGPVTCQLIDNWSGRVVSEGFMMIILY